MKYEWYLLPMIFPFFLKSKFNFIGIEINIYLRKRKLNKDELNNDL